MRRKKNIRFTEAQGKHGFSRECLKKLREGIKRSINKEKTKLGPFDQKGRNYWLEMNKFGEEMISEISTAKSPVDADIEHKSQTFSESINERIAYSAGGPHEEIIFRTLRHVVSAVENGRTLSELRKMLAAEFGLSGNKSKKLFTIKLDKKDGLSYLKSIKQD